MTLPTSLPLHRSSRLALLALLALLACKPSTSDSKAEAEPAAARSAGRADASAPEASAAPTDSAVANAKISAEVSAPAPGPNAEGAEPEPDAESGAVPTPTADAVSSGPPTTVDLSKLYWAAGNDSGQAVVDIIDISATPGNKDPLVALMEAHHDPDSEDGDDGPVRLPRRAELPEGLSRGQRWVLATADGEQHGKAVGFQVEMGPSEGHLLVELDVKGTGLAARAEDWKSTPLPLLRPPKPLDLSEGAGKALFEAIRPGLPGTGDSEAQSAMRGKRIAAGDLQVVSGRFPRGFTHLVALTMPRVRGENAGDMVSGLLLADASGRLESLFPTQVTLEHYEVLHLVDIEGDGLDEAIWESSYHEGGYTNLLAWDATGAKIARTLTGDGL